MKHHNAETCFGFTDEIYIGSWFGHDVYEYNSHGEKNLLATLGDEGGQYATWVGVAHWFDPNATIFYVDEKRSVPIAEHLTSGNLQKAFLMGFAAIYNRKREGKNVGLKND